MRPLHVAIEAPLLDDAKIEGPHDDEVIGLGSNTSIVFVLMIVDQHAVFPTLPSKIDVACGFVFAFGLGTNHPNLILDFL